MNDFGRYRRRRTRRRGQRRPVAPWLGWLALLVLGGAVIVLYGGRLDGLDALRPAGDAVQVRFKECGMMVQRNCVIDGDTIRYGGEKIRLADIDTPEISSLRCEAEEALGQRAKRRLLELLNAGPIRLVHLGGPDRDRYGRLLRVVERNGRSLGDMLVAEGLARRWDGARPRWC